MATPLDNLIYQGRGRLELAGGPASVKAADAKRRVEDARNLWPYAWSYPPPDSEERNPTGYIAVPAIAPTTPVLVFQYKVPSGFQFEMLEVMFCAVTTGMIPIANPGDFLYTVNRNTPASGVAPQGSPIADLQNVPFNFGTTNQGGFTLKRSLNFQPTDVISLYVTNVSFGSPGSPNFIVGRFAGWQRKA